MNTGNNPSSREEILSELLNKKQMLAAFNEESICVFVTQSFCAFTSSPAEDIEGENFQDISFFKGLSVFNELKNRVLSGVDSKIDFDYTDRFGKQIPLKIEITHNKKGTKSLFYLELIWEKAIDSDPPGVEAGILETTTFHFWTLDTPGNYGDANKGHLDFLGLNRRKIQGMHLQDFRAWSEKEKNLRYNKQCFLTGKTLESTEYLRDRNGVAHILKIYRNPIMDDDGNVKYIWCLGIDISDSKRLEDRVNALRLMWTNLLNITETSDVIECVLDTILSQVDEFDGAIFYNLTPSGYSPSIFSGAGMDINYGRIITRTMDEFNILSAQKEMRINMESILESDMEYYKAEGATAVVAYPLVFMGEYFGTFVFISLVYTEIDSETIAFLREVAGYCGPVIKRLKTDKEMIQARENSELINQELEKAIENANQLALKAEIASIAKSEFLTNMSHEIRTPLNGIIGMADMLSEMNLSAEAKEYVNILRSSSKALQELVNDILDFSKIESGKIELEEVEFDFVKLIEEVTDVQAITAFEKGLDFNCFIDPTLRASMIGDPHRLRQVLLNLTGNAIKFTRKGEISITCEQLYRSSDSLKMLIKVSDTGIGIPKSRHKLIFDPFTQADNSTTRNYGGSGLGLSITSRLVKLLHGEIGVESTEGLGSTFWFTCEFSTTYTGANDHEEKFLNGRTILIIDDNRERHRVYESIISSRLSILVFVEDMVKATEYLDENIPDLIIVDNKSMGDSETMLWLKVYIDKGYRNTKIIKVSEISLYENYTELRQTGYWGLLRKPLKYSNIIDCLSTIAHGQKYFPEQSRISTDELLVHTRLIAGESTVLVVEDNSTNQKVLSAVLEKTGLSCKIAANGKEAVKLLEKEKFDLIVMDVQMPEMDGFQATRIIRDPSSKVLWHEVPIIAMTAGATELDREKCLKAGMNDYLAKPIDIERFRKKILRILGASTPEETQDSIVRLDNAVLDYNQLMARLYSDIELIKEIIGSYISDLNQKYYELVDFLEKGNFNEIRKTAHTLKGASMNVSAIRIAEHSKAIEEAAGLSDEFKVSVLLKKLPSEIESLKIQLKLNKLI
ncbi:response regulator [Myxococcota bacterium]|nr:response regulator [Myxococcota bacterium]MBU1382197.1 response regulator [Myxococcota bacterium]MBU1497901.1 response regulator [Myxococcota bacterium]